MKVLFVSNLYAPHVVGGAELTLQTLAEELARVGHTVEVLSLAVDGIESTDIIGGVTVRRVLANRQHGPFNRRKSSLGRLQWHVGDIYNGFMGERVAQIIDRFAPDVVSTHNLGGFSIAVWDVVHARGIRLLHTLHDYYLLCPRVTMFKTGGNCDLQCAKCWLFSLRKRRASQQVDVVIGVSRFVLDKHVEHGFFRNAKHIVIYNSRKWKVPSPSEGSGAGAPRPLRIGYIGRIEAAKGIEVLLEAVSRLAPESWELRIAGKAPEPAYGESLRRRYALPQIEYLGFVKPDAFYLSVDLVVIPSIWNEPLGVVAYEAMGFGRPVIAARRGGLPEMVEGTGAGWLFEPNDVDELRRLLARAASDPGLLAAMRGACLKQRQLFVPEIQAREFQAVLGP
jgi:glycosyltransferase involved in cell wall biosynthesis